MVNHRIKNILLGAAVALIGCASLCHATGPYWDVKPTTWSTGAYLSYPVAFKGTNPWIDVRAYGAVGDGVTDDRAAIQAAHDAAAAAGTSLGFPTVYFPAGKYLSSAQITWGSVVHAVAGGNVIIQFSSASGKGFYVSTEFANFTSTTSAVRYGRSRLFEGSFTIENTNGSGSNTSTGIYFGNDGNSGFSAESKELVGVKIRGWSKGIQFGSHAYLLGFHACRFEDNGTAIYLATNSTAGIALTDRLERISFDNNTFAGNTNVIDGVATVGGDISFMNSSFDYNTRLLASFTSTLILSFSSGCHFEWNSGQQLMTLGGSSVSMSDYYMFYNSTTVPSALIGIGANGELDTRGATFNTPASVSIFTLAASTSKIEAEESYKQFGGASNYIDNSGAGTIVKHVTVHSTSGYEKLPDGTIFEWGTIPNTAIGSNATVNTTITFSLAFPTACVHANASVQPDASADFYGITQRVVTGTPLTTTTFSIRNGASAQNFVNGTWFAVGY